jgi:Tol biopolymer transport system component
VLRSVIGLALCVLTAGTAAAQPFGRNKVHYEDLDFRVLVTPHFDIYYYPAEHAATLHAARMAERWYDRLSATLHHQFTERQPIVFYASHAQFAQTNVLPGFIPDSVGGVTEHERGRIILPFAAGLGETDHVLGHELVHAFQRDILRSSGRSMSLLPLWFLEGMAEYLSIGRIDANTAMWLRDAARQPLPAIDRLDDGRWFPYRYGQALWAYLAGRFGDEVVVTSLSAKGSAVARIVSATGQDAASLSRGWHEWIHTLAGDARSDTDSPGSTAIVAGGSGGRLNVAPSLSPDGASLVFLSERGQYSIDVYVADAATGTVRRTLVETAGDPHFDSLQFIESAGAWDPEGRRFALAALAGGQPVLAIYDMKTAALVREFPIHGTDQVFGPTWSPDGRHIAMSAMAGGLSDLYVLDVDSGNVRALTTDPFADLQPAWSPDGRTIVFSTDRFSSSLDALRFGDYGLAMMDVETGAVRALPGVALAKNIDPHWSGDGASVFFVADPGGVSNVYRVVVASGEVFQVTAESIGVSGVTALSPALSASAGDRIAFSVYRQGGYDIHVIDARTQPARSYVPQVTTSAAPVVDAPSVAFSDRPYRAALSLDRFVQPYLSAGGSSAGGFVRGGVGLSFGDMLGDHHLEVAVQAGRTLDDFILQGAYLNQRNRWNWGIAGGQVAWLTGTGPGAFSQDGSTIARQSDVYRQLHRELSGVAMYPFSRSKRVEFTAGVHSITYDRESTLSTFSSVSGGLLSSDTAISAAAPTATIFEAGTALVYDTAVFGPASPVLGQRYRFAVAPSFGSIDYTSVTADYRRYVMPVAPFTIAMRVMHQGRYGSGADDPRLLPLAWTLRDLVRGYGDWGSNASSLPYLSANRFLLGNVELRFPIPGAFDRGARFSQLPLEGLVFTDASRFWVPSSASPSGAGTLRSIGTGVRLVAAGFVFELDAVRPLDQPVRGWTFAFNFRPGF